MVGLAGCLDYCQSQTNFTCEPSVAVVGLPKPRSDHGMYELLSTWQYPLYHASNISTLSMNPQPLSWRSLLVTV